MEMLFSNSGGSGLRGMAAVRKAGAAVLGAGLLMLASGEAGKPVYRPLDFGGFFEFGQLQSGQYGENPAFHDEWTDHFGAYLAQTVLAEENLAFDIGLGGVLEYQKREVLSSQWGGTQYKNFFIGPSVADIRYAGAARDRQGFGLQFGLFPYKYNPDAVNLGEYLFRTGAYPDYIASGGLWFVNNTSVQLQGLKASYGRGGLSGDLLLITETSMPALYDISGAALLGYKSPTGFFEAGAGINFKHMIPVKPSHTTPHNAENTYFTKEGVTYSGNDLLYFGSANFYKRRMKEDPANAARYDSLAKIDSIKGENVRTWLADPVAGGITPEYYTERGLIVMARASLDLKKLMDSDTFGPNDLRLYVEGAILGVKNYPLYYEKITQRMPIMAGFNLPCFKALDLFSLQVEYFNSPHLNSYSELVNTNSAVPTQPLGSNVTRSRTGYDDITKHDNLSWSILAKKSLGGAAFIAAQAARDHIRTVSIETWTAPEPTEVLGRSSDWYWMLQFGYGI
jgi:hypothetical protein